MVKGNCLIGQSGGPTCVINSSLLGVINEAKKHSEIDHIYGTINGINGVINDNIIELTDYDDKELQLLKQTPGAILGSVRYCLDINMDKEEYQKILNTFKKYNIRYFFYIGGNDSMDTVLKLSKYCKVIGYECYIIGIPKTIDNDLTFTDHTPGYGSAIKFIANSVSQIMEDTKCYNNGRVTIVEIMGRDAGWLTAGAKLSSLNGNNPDLIYLPESAFNINKFLEDVEKLYNKNKKVLVCISEGIKDNNNHYIVNDFAYMEDNDVFGHMQLGGAANVLAHIIKEKLDLPVRAIELNLLQRCFSSVSSSVDIKEAINCGKFAVKMSLKKQSGKMVIMERISSSPYKIKYDLKEIELIANKTKYFPVEWIVNGNDISSDFIDYALPLINKEYNCKYTDGIIKFAKIKKTS